MPTESNEWGPALSSSLERPTLPFQGGPSNFRRFWRLTAVRGLVSNLLTFSTDSVLWESGYVLAVENRENSVTWPPTAVLWQHFFWGSNWEVLTEEAGEAGRHFWWFLFLPDSTSGNISSAGASWSRWLRKPVQQVGIGGSSLCPPPLPVKNKIKKMKKSPAFRGKELDLT